MRQVQSRFTRRLSLTLLMTLALSAAKPGLAAPPKEKKGTSAVSGQLPVKMTRDQVKFFNRTQRQLVTKFNGKDNPGDLKTWYTLLFLDEVAVQELERKGAKLLIATTLAAKPHGVVVQGKKEAALEVAKFWYGVNSAADGLTPALHPQKSVSRGAGNKRWWSFAFKTRQEAEKRLILALPRKAEK